MSNLPSCARAQRDRLNLAFEVMDDEARHLLLAVAMQYAVEWPAIRTKPMLSVVSIDKPLPVSQPRAQPTAVLRLLG